MRKPNVTEQLQLGFKKIIRHRSYCLKKKLMALQKLVLKVFYKTYGL